MFKKIRTTVHSSGRVERSQPLAYLNESSVEADKRQQRRAYRDSALRVGRIVSMEETLTTLVVVYASGTVDIHQWIAE